MPCGEGRGIELNLAGTFKSGNREEVVGSNAQSPT